MIIISPLLFGIDGVSSFAGVRRSYSKEVNQYIRDYSQRIKDEITEAIKKIDPKLSASRYIKEAFNTQYKIKGSNATINLNQILKRRGLKVEGDITAEIIRRTGFNTPSQNIVSEIKRAVLKKNKKSMAQLVGNEMHKAREQAKIDDLINKGFAPRKKAFVFHTQGDDDVRPSHSAEIGEKTLADAQDARNGVMADPNCRCFLTSI